MIDFLGFLGFRCSKTGFALEDWLDGCCSVCFFVFFSVGVWTWAWTWARSGNWSAKGNTAGIEGFLALYETF